MALAFEVQNQQPLHLVHLYFGTCFGHLPLIIPFIPLIFYPQSQGVVGKSENTKLEKMSRRSGRGGPKLDLKLNLSPPHMANPRVLDSPGRSATVSPTSPPSSCVSSELEDEDFLHYLSSPEATSPMMLVGCPRCLMYVMLSEEDPRCPKCKSTVLLDVSYENNSTTAKKNTRNS